MELHFTWHPGHAKLDMVITFCEVGLFHYCKVVNVYCAQTQLFDIAIQLFALVILLIIYVTQFGFNKETEVSGSNLCEFLLIVYHKP